MYSKLRRLVLEYLGISPTPIKQSSDVEMAVAAGYQQNDNTTSLPYADAERRGQSAPLPTRRSWSRPSITDSSEKTHANIPTDVQTKSPPAPRGTVVS